MDVMWCRVDVDVDVVWSDVQSWGWVDVVGVDVDG